MAGFIKQNCNNCALCEPICPTHSILMGYSHYVIDTDTCEECLLCVPICPLRAIEVNRTEEAPPAAS